MLHLRHFACLSPYRLSSSSSINKPKNSIRILGDKVLFGFKRSGRNGLLKAVDKDSEFEIDPDKAREALRKLDEQLQSLSNKQVSTPKIRAQDLNPSSSGEREAASEISGSFLTYLASFLLVFTIFYNIIFLTVIKPSIDGAEPPFQSADIIREAQEGEPQQQLSRSTEFP